ncbi:MAG: CBS domain-containing protein [Rhizobiaceae bacterium]|nr:CBS domain-containing protein [Rhizobiaceae bacterium]MCV0408035.1 CBS domain-containing protein [Rhizobiaceae bacterium]
MKPATGATPLGALDALAIDTETTGLDTTTARIVQIGAVPVRRGRPQKEAAWQTLVDPGVPIPASATAIHHIGNEDVADQPGFADALASLRELGAGRVLIGYSIGFDLAVMEREAARAGLAWTRPRTLCVRLLSMIANPNLPDQSIETICAWLGIAIEGRHSAAGDAFAAAEIFCCLLPFLSKKGVRTLGEAERAVLGLTAHLESGHQAGWSEPVLRPGDGGRRAMGGVDPYAYRHRICEVMSSPAVILPAATRAETAIDEMTKRRISSVFVCEHGEPDRPLGEYGIVTERDMMRLIAREGQRAFDIELGAIASRPLASIRAEAFVYRAIGRMDRLGIRHLAVRDEDRRLVGVVSARDLLRLRASAAITLDDEIEAAGNPGDMAAAWSTLPAVATSLIGEGVEARMIAEIISEELRIMTRKAAELALAEMAAQDWGTPPCGWTLLVLGSGGRGESLLAADQDNAILFETGDPDGPEDRWFAELGRRVADTLDTAGIPLCKGGVMAKNAAWRGSLQTWLERVADWVSRSRPEDLLNVDIFFDLRAVAGDPALARQLMPKAHEMARGSPLFAKLLGERVGGSGSPFTLLGGFKTDEGRIDLKKHGLFPVVAMARTLALRHGIEERSTRPRLEGLIALDVGSARDLSAIMEAHELVMRVMLDQQSRDLEEGVPVSNRVEVAKLSRADQSALKAALKHIRMAPDLVRDLMFG